jgi:hypothetical protein
MLSHDSVSSNVIHNTCSVASVVLCSSNAWCYPWAHDPWAHDHNLTELETIFSQKQELNSFILSKPRDDASALRGQMLALSTFQPALFQSLPFFFSVEASFSRLAWLSSWKLPKMWLKNKCHDAFRHESKLGASLGRVKFCHFFAQSFRILIYISGMNTPNKIWKAERKYFWTV